MALCGLCNRLHACVRTQDSINMCKFVQVGSCVVVCHVLAVISFRCLVSQDLCFTVCSAYTLHSDSQHYTMGRGKTKFFSADLLLKESKHTHWYCCDAFQVDCLGLFLTAGPIQTFSQGQIRVIQAKRLYRQKLEGFYSTVDCRHTRSAAHHWVPAEESGDHTQQCYAPW